jgi:RNA polymerase sigma-70 factor (ECF subfamily)
VNTDSETAGRAAAEQAARDSYGRLVAWLAARSGDITTAEDALSDAFAAALADWPLKGVPVKPQAWLMATAKRKLVDGHRRRRTGVDAAGHLRLLAEEAEDAMKVSDFLPDRRLALMFACAHPALDQAVRAPLILQTLLGLDAAAIGSAFLVSPAAMGQRLVRAKAKISEAGIRLTEPEPDQLRDRLPAVLDAIYAAFGEGWSDADGSDPRRRNLAEEGIWLGRLLAGLLPQEPETLGLLALMLHAEARRPARRDGSGGFVALSEQDTALWNAGMVAEAETLLFRAASAGRPGRYQLEAAIQSAHAIRRHGFTPDWPAIVMLYNGLHSLVGSPATAVGRAAALAQADGAQAGLAALDDMAGDPRLAAYQPWWATRAALLAQAGLAVEAAAAYDRAIGLSSDPAVRAFLQQRREAVTRGVGA